jgi:hypothetical protein
MYSAAHDNEKLPISKSTIENATFWSIFLSATEKTQQPFLSRTIKKTNISEESVEALIKEFLSNESRNVEKGVIFNFLNNINEFLKKVAFSIVDCEIGSFSLSSLFSIALVVKL